LASASLEFAHRAAGDWSFQNQLASSRCFTLPKYAAKALKSVAYNALLARLDRSNRSNSRKFYEPIRCGKTPCGIVHGESLTPSLGVVSLLSRVLLHHQKPQSKPANQRAKALSLAMR
jgi:hypothetical protein